MNKEADLIDSVVKGNLNKVQELLKAGADLNAKDNEERTALDHAKIQGHTQVEKLIKGTDSIIKTKIIKKGKIEIVPVILKNQQHEKE